LGRTKQVTMKITFGTKEQHNAMRRQAFLSLPKSERVTVFLRLMEKSARLYNFHYEKKKNEDKNNFVLDLRMKWEENINEFIRLANKYNVKMLLVGGGAVNFHGYQRHSADVDFWIDTTPENLNRLLAVLNQMGYNLTDFPEKVKKQEQNISIKFSPYDLDLELITRFNINKTFDGAYKDAESVTIAGEHLMKYKVLSFDDLILSKMKSDRIIDKLDIEQLQKIKNTKKQ